MSEKISLNEGWKFYTGDLFPRTHEQGWGGAKAKSMNFGAAAPDFDDSGWKDVCLPHDYAIEGDYIRKKDEVLTGDKIPDQDSQDARSLGAGSLSPEVGWYRKKFRVRPEHAGKRFRVEFEGVYRDCTVYLNRHFVMNHEGGYTPFSADVTDFIDPDGENLIAVRVNPKEHEGWWYEGAGIYRPVTMAVYDDIYIAEDGVFVTAVPDLESGNAKVTAEICVESRSLEKAGAAVRARITDPDGKIAAEAGKNAWIPAWGQRKITLEFEIEDTRLWSPETPEIYTLETDIIENRTGKVWDAEKTEFGIREIRFDAEKGLFLNGKNIRANGYCLHMDHAGVGTALTKSVMEYKLRKIKESGANAIRCSHNPGSEEWMRLCDKIGLLVMAETRITSSAPVYLDELRTLVKKGRNHPCVFLWSIGNEEVNLIFEKDAPAVARTMRMEVKKLDPTRSVTMAAVYWNPNSPEPRNVAPEELYPVGEEMDVFGLNYWPEKWDAYHAAHPNQPMINTEANTRAWTRETYETDKNRGWTYQFDESKGIPEGGFRFYAEERWRAYMAHEFISGYFLWTAFDYRGEPSPMKWPAISSQFGVMDTCGYEKDMYYYFKAQMSDEPVMHVFPNWNRRGMEGKTLTVYAHTNAEEAELFVNGVSQGRKTVEPGSHAEWPGVIYQPGEIRAVGYRKGKEIVSVTRKTTGAPAKIVLKAWKKELGEDDDTGIIRVEIQDAEGNIVPTADPVLSFEVTGAGTFLGCGNGDSGDHDADKAPSRRAFRGLCQVLVKPEGTGEIRVKARSWDLGEAECVLRKK